MEIFCELKKTHNYKIECKYGTHGTFFYNISIDDGNCIKVLMIYILG